jgi:hypothetical protein
VIEPAGAPTETPAGPPHPAPRRRAFDGAFLFITIVGVAAAAATWALRGPDVFFDVLGKDLVIFGETMPKLLAAVLLACWLRLLLSRAVIARYLGAGSGWRGLLIATGAGIVVPGGPMTAFPLTIAFFEGGADRGTVIAFVTSWLVLSAQRTIVWEMAFLDAELVGLRVLVCLPLPILLGWLARHASGVLDVAPDRQTGAGDGERR